MQTERNIVYADIDVVHKSHCGSQSITAPQAGFAVEYSVLMLANFDKGSTAIATDEKTQLLTKKGEWAAI